jgi:signal transduction histidine kinase
VRRHLVLVMVGIVAGALLLAGAGTYLLAGRRLRADDAVVTLRQARKVAAEVPVIVSLKSARLRHGVIALLRDTAGLHFVVVRPGGGVAGAVPAGLTDGDLQPGRLLLGGAVSGVSGEVSYAAVPVPGLDAVQVPALAAGGTLVVVIVEALPPSRLGLDYLLLVSGGALVVAFVVALVVSRRISRPLEEAVATTGRISGGDLDARVPEEAGRYPELSSLTSSINSMAAALARSRTRERQFLLSVSHDLRTPLTSILGYAEAIGDGTVDDVPAAAGVIAGEARRLERLVGDLLELARLDRRQFSLHPVEVDIGALVRDCAEGMRIPVEEAGLVLNVPIGGGGAGPVSAARAFVDPDRLAQVVANLVENAYKFASRTVQVWAGRSGRHVVVTVDDDGPGIPPQEQGRVFDRFFQVRAGPAARQAGTGLGLAIVAELVAAMGGSVQVLSPTTPTGGTRMEVRFPASGGPTAPAAHPSGPGRPA